MSYFLFIYLFLCCIIRSLKEILQLFVDSKCTYTRNGEWKGETEYRKEKSAEEGTETANKGDMMIVHFLLKMMMMKYTETIPIWREFVSLNQYYRLQTDSLIFTVGLTSFAIVVTDCNISFNSYIGARVFCEWVSEWVRRSRILWTFLFHVGTKGSWANERRRGKGEESPANFERQRKSKDLNYL